MLCFSRPAVAASSSTSAAAAVAHSSMAAVCSNVVAKNPGCASKTFGSASSQTHNVPASGRSSLTAFSCSCCCIVHAGTLATAALIRASSAVKSAARCRKMSDSLQNAGSGFISKAGGCGTRTAACITDSCCFSACGRVKYERQKMRMNENGPPPEAEPKWLELRLLFEYLRARCGCGVPAGHMCACAHARCGRRVLLRPRRCLPTCLR